jgi:SOS response regulatory protein OraA/RecX
MAHARSAQDRRAAALARRARRAEITDPDIVMDAAAAFLAVRPRSMAETRRRLCQLGYPPALVDGVVARLVELGYLDDAAFARAWVESRDRARPRGSAALRQELLRAGVARDVIDQVLDERRSGGFERSEASLHGSESGASGAALEWTDGTPGAGERRPDADVAAARRLLERRAAAMAREQDPRRRRQKAYALLARHGFAPDVCRAVSSVVTDTDGGDDDGDDGAV